MTRPNILLIITDSQGANVLGECGSGYITTPNIDRLAETGISFRRAYNCSPLCTPARAALFSGLHPHNAGAWSNDLPLGKTVVSIGEFFRRAGYDTAYIGKWHLDGTDYFGTGICPAGWDPRYWYDGRNYLEDLSADERTLWRTGLRTPEAVRAHRITREWTWAGRITDRARSFIRRGRPTRKPWLLVVSYDEPHGPSVCPPPFCDMYEDFLYPPPENARDTLERKPALHRAWAATFSIPEEGLRQPLYFGASSFVDDEIGRLVACALDSGDAGEHDKTIIVYTTDHGHYLGAHGLDGKGPALYEEVVRVPLIMSGPGIPAGVISSSLASHLDLLPTLLALAGDEAPPIVEGVSLAPVLNDPVATVRSEVTTEFHRFSVTHDSWFGFVPIRSIITDRYKLTVNLFDHGRHGDELYDLDADPGEMRNLIASPEHLDIAAALHRRLLELQAKSRDPFRGPVWADRSWSPVEVSRGIGGKRRPRPRDGFLPVPFNYDTGMPADRGDA